MRIIRQSGASPRRSLRCDEQVARLNMSRASIKIRSSPRPSYNDQSRHDAFRKVRSLVISFYDESDTLRITHGRHDATLLSDARQTFIFPNETLPCFNSMVAAKWVDDE